MIPLNKATSQQGRLFIAGVLSGAARSLESACDAAPNEKEFRELDKLVYKLQIAADEFWRRAQLEVLDGG